MNDHWRHMYLIDYTDVVKLVLLITNPLQKCCPLSQRSYKLSTL